VYFSRLAFCNPAQLLGAIADDAGRMLAGQDGEARS
jgi:hypothetical protein